MHVVGGPVAAGASVLVLVSAADTSVWLDAVDAKTGAVKWKLPEGFSEITAGVAATPLAYGGVALALVPASSGQNDGFLRAEGVDVASGAVLWQSQAPVLVADAPSTCPKPLGGRGFCVIVQAAASSQTVLVALSPKTGAALATVPNIERAMSTTPGLYQTDGTPSVLAGIRVPGGASWSKPVASLFGAKYDPDNGWDFDQYGNVEAGSVGKASAGKTEDLGTTKTVAFSQTTGKPIWAIPGLFQCGGGDGIHGPYLCLMTGTITWTAKGAAIPSKNATATLEGFDPPTGKITWRLAVGGLAELLLGNIAIKDAHHVVVTSLQGRKLILDLRSGATTAPATGEVFWCARLNLFKIQPPKGIQPERVGSSLFAPCDENRHPVTSIARPPGVAGATIGQTFIWAASDGLKATNQLGR